MPRGYRVAIIALGLAASVAWGQDQEPAGTFLEGQPIPAPRQSESIAAEEGGAVGEGQAAPQGSDQPRAVDARADELMSVLNRIEAALRELQSPGEDERQLAQDQRDERGLRAREELAFWVRAMFWTGIGAVLLSAGALALVFLTLHQARRAGDTALTTIGEARETTRAAIAAAEQASNANDAAGRALSGLNRPYVVPLIVGHNLPKYVTAKVSANDELVASIIYKNSGSSPAVLKRISPIASTISATSEPEPISPFYFDRELFLELETGYLEPGETTKEITVRCSLPKRVRALAASRGLTLLPLTDEAAKVVLQDRLVYTDLLGNETVVSVRYDYALGIFELIHIREERASLREAAEPVRQVASTQADAASAPRPEGTTADVPWDPISRFPAAE